MEGHELPLLAPDQPEIKVELIVQSSMTARFYSDREPWFDVKLLSGGEPYHGAEATQPLSCLQAVEEGRRTALMCSGGVLALHRKGDEVRVDYHNAGGSHLQAACAVADYRALIQSLAGED